MWLLCESMKQARGNKAASAHLGGGEFRSDKRNTKDKRAPHTDGTQGVSEALVIFCLRRKLSFPDKSNSCSTTIVVCIACKCITSKDIEGTPARFAEGTPLLELKNVDMVMLVLLSCARLLYGPSLIYCIRISAPLRRSFCPPFHTPKVVDIFHSFSLRGNISYLTTAELEMALSLIDGLDLTRREVSRPAHDVGSTAKVCTINKLQWLRGATWSL